jgi:16S rRNA (cytosine967-C5)-methyltransferase
MAKATSGVPARRLALRALKRIDVDGAYANLLLPKMLAESQLSERDRGLVTELVYGTTRMRRACDYVVDRYVLGKVDNEVRNALRLGAYQMVFMDTPPHAAVSATVGAVKGRGGSMVNAVLRKVGGSLEELKWPDESTRLSYPNWILKSLSAELGESTAVRALEAMNQRASAVERDDGYIQDPASVAVVAALDSAPGMLVADLCAAPGGKATGIARSGAAVIASDLNQTRTGLIAENATRLNYPVMVVAADGLRPPYKPGVFDRVLIDAPCSGLGSLRRRPDARWRIDAAAPGRLASLQTKLVDAGLELLAPEGKLVYSVCTLTKAESTGVLEFLGDKVIVESSDLQLPDETDGMFTAVMRRA